MHGGVTAGAAFEHRDFRLAMIAKGLSVTGGQMMTVAVGWHVYELTRRPLDLGLVGLAQFVPAAALSLVAGHTADRFDKKRILAHGIHDELIETEPGYARLVQAYEEEARRLQEAS